MVENKILDFNKGKTFEISKKFFKDQGNRLILSQKQSSLEQYKLVCLLNLSKLKKKILFFKQAHF